MATRSRQYLDWNLQNKANSEHRESGTNVDNTGFIILPPWVADKITLAGGNLTELFYGLTVPKVQSVEPSDPVAVAHMLMESTKSEINHEQRQAAADRVRWYLSEEDIADIGLFTYLLSDALHLVNPLSGLCHAHEFSALFPMRNVHMTRNTADGRWCKLGQVSINNGEDQANARIPPTPYSDFTYDVIDCNTYANKCGLQFEFNTSKGVSLDGICKYAYERITSICENIPERIERSGDVAKVYSDKGSIVCVPHMATVSNVAYMLSRFAPDDESKRRQVDGFNSAKERLLALIEQIVAERRRWVGTHGCARDGLVVLYTRQL